MSISVPFLPESIADKAIAMFYKLKKKYKGDAVKAIRDAAKFFAKKGVTFYLLQKEMVRRHSLIAAEKRAYEAAMEDQKERDEFQKSWEENEITSSLAYRDEFGQFVHLYIGAREQ